MTYTPYNYAGIIPEGIPNCIPLERFDGMKIECPDEAQYLTPNRVYHLWYQVTQLKQCLKLMCNISLSSDLIESRLGKFDFTDKDSVKINANIRILTKPPSAPTTLLLAGLCPVLPPLHGRHLSGFQLHQAPHHAAP